MSYETTANHEVHVRGASLELVDTPASAAVIKVGDTVRWDAGNNVIEAVEEYWNGSETQSQDDIKSVFMGVAIDQSLAGETEPIRVLAPAPTSVFRFALTADTVDIGDLVTPEKKSGNALAGNLLQTTTNQSAAIGRIVWAADYDNAVTEVFVVFDSELLTVPKPAAT